MDSIRDYNVGKSNYAKKKIQPWDIWLEYDLNPWDADIIKRILRTKEDEPRSLDYEKVIHICQERLRQLKKVQQNETPTASDKVLKVFDEKVKEAFRSSALGRTEEWKDTELPPNSDGVPLDIDYYSEECDCRYYKPSFSPEWTISEADYNKLPPGEKDKWEKLRPCSGG